MYFSKRIVKILYKNFFIWRNPSWLLCTVHVYVHIAHNAQYPSILAAVLVCVLQTFIITINIKHTVNEKCTVTVALKTKKLKFHFLVLHVFRTLYFCERKQNIFVIFYFKPSLLWPCLTKIKNVFVFLNSSLLLNVIFVSLT